MYISTYTCITQWAQAWKFVDTCVRFCIRHKKADASQLLRAVGHKRCTLCPPWILGGFLTTVHHSLSGPWKLVLGANVMILKNPWKIATFSPPASGWPIGISRDCAQVRFLLICVTLVYMEYPQRTSRTGDPNHHERYVSRFQTYEKKYVSSEAIISCSDALVARWLAAILQAPWTYSFWLITI